MKLNIKRILLIDVTFAFLLITSVSFAASSATKNKVTWTFDRDYTTGQYANGDPWVVGPVTISAISPTPTDTKNGVMINPVIDGAQGFDNALRDSTYDAALNKGTTLPLTVATNSSVISTITAENYTQFGTIEVFAILTVVETAPAPGSFRPPAVGAGSRASEWNEAQLDYARLASLDKSVLTTVPSMAAVAADFAYPWFEMYQGWTGRYLHPSYMGETGYGREIAMKSGDAALLLNLNFTNAQKRALLIGLVQVGIDNYGFIQHGGAWYADGGHNCGRLSPLIVAAAVLNDSGMKLAIKGSGMKFQEFQQTFTITESDVGRTLGYGQWDNSDPRQWVIAGSNLDPIHVYTAADIGKGEWGIRHHGEPQKDNNFWAASYRDIGGGVLIAPSTVARVMGMRGTIDWEPLFLYVDRHIGYEQSAGYAGEFSSNPPTSFQRQFYNTYKDAVIGSPGVNVPSVPSGLRIRR
jgi:hypothetical protein